MFCCLSVGPLTIWSPWLRSLCLVENVTRVKDQLKGLAIMSSGPSCCEVHLVSARWQSAALGSSEQNTGDSCANTQTQRNINTRCLQANASHDNRRSVRFKSIFRPINVAVDTKWAKCELTKQSISCLVIEFCQLSEQFKGSVTNHKIERWDLLGIRTESPMGLLIKLSLCFLHKQMNK